MRRTPFLIALLVGISTIVSCSDDGTSPTETPPHAFRMSGQFLVTEVPGVINGNPATGVFGDLFGTQIRFDIGFDELLEVHRRTKEDGVARVEYESDPVSVRMEGGGPVASQVAAQLSGRNFRFTLSSEASFLDFIGGIMGAEADAMYTLELSAAMPANVGMSGHPVLSDFDHTAGTAILRRLVSGGTQITDWASGAATMSLAGTN